MPHNTKRPRPLIGIALSGGSALGIAHIGVLKSLRDHNVEIGCIAGTSAGALVAACYAFDIPLEKITEKASKLSWYSVSKFSFSTLGFVSNVALGKILKEFLGGKNIEDATIPLAIVATDIESGERVVFRKGSVLDALLASTSIPGIFVPHEFEGRLLVDGGLVDNLPFAALDELGATMKIGVDVNRWISRARPKNLLDMIVKSFEIATTYRDPLEGNEILIEPHLEKFSPSDFNKAEQLVDEGYRATTPAIEKIHDLTRKHVRKNESLWEKVKQWLG
jgi:NTE family protein